jgi:hypothetical protein
MQLQTARQRKGESPREFADRCRSLANKVMSKVDDPVPHPPRKSRSYDVGKFCCGPYEGSGAPKYATQLQKIFGRRFPLLFQSKRLKSRRNLTKRFIRGLINRFGCCHGRPVGQGVRTASHDKQRTRKRDDACEVSATLLHVTIAGHRTQRLRMHRPKLPSGAMSTKG